MLATVASCLALLAAHPNSHSSSRIVVEGPRIALELRCQTQSLVEALEIDRDGDRELDAGELEAARAPIAAYLRERYQLFADAQSSVALALGAFELSVSRSDSSAFSEQLVDARATCVLPKAPERLSIRCRLFLERDPFHRDSASLVWNGEAPVAWLFAEGVERWDFEPAAARRPGVFKSYVELGVEHILIGYDHIAFLLALLVASRRWRSIALFVTAFTLAHSLTLGAASLGWIRVPSQLVEMAIALSIAYVAALNLFAREPSSRWLEAFGFGLIHGLGFAGVLADSLIAEPLVLTALVGFNLGVELGQLAIVTAAALLVRWLPGERSAGELPRAWLAPRWIRLGLSSIVVMLGLYWFAERAGWLG